MGLPATQDKITGEGVAPAAPLPAFLRMDGRDVPLVLDDIGIEPARFVELLQLLSGDAVSPMTIWKYGKAYIQRVPPGLVCFIRLIEHLMKDPVGRHLLAEHPVMGPFFKDTRHG